MTVMLAAERTAAPVQQQAGSLAIRADQIEWNAKQSAVLQQSGIENDVTAAELSAFLHLCQRTKLDPFSRQIYLIGRWDGRKGRKVYTPQTSIDGYRVIAHRAAGEAGHTFGYGDTVWCAKDGRWQDAWLTDEPPAAAKVTVVRNGQRFSAVARYSEYVQTKKDGGLTGLWGKMPATMTAKCAEALALRMAFPHDLAGVYTAEEMAQADSGEQDRVKPSVMQHVVQRERQAPAQDAWEQATPAAGPRPLQAPAPAGPAPLQGEPLQTPAESESLTPTGRDYLAEAYEAADQAAARRIYDDAKAEGAVPVYLAQIAQVGMTKPEVAPTEPVQTAATMPVSTPDPLPGSPDDPKARGLAVVELYAAGRDNALVPGEVQQAFTARYGHGVDAATAAELAEFTADLTAAAGAR